MLIHVGHKLESHLYAIYGVTYDLIISTATSVSTCILGSRCLLNKLSHSSINICVSLLFWRAHHTSLDVRYHEKDNRHQEKNGNRT